MQDRGLRPAAVTVDHGLRPESASEAEAVRTLCAARGIAHDTLALSLSDGPDLQNRARQGRYRALADWARDRGLRSVAVGHTADDLAESFLMRLADGAGLDGLAAMEPRFVRFGTIFLRPLLGVRKAELTAFLEARGIPWVEDPSNVNLRFERVRARHLLSQLDIDPEQIAASARALRQVRQSMDSRTRDLLARMLTQDRGDLLLTRDAFASLQREDPEQARRVLLACLRGINGHDYPPRRAEQMELMRRVATSETTTLAGCLLTFETDRLRIAREPAAALAAPAARVGETWDTRWHVTGPAGTIRALGEAIVQTPWRETGLPRRSLLASPAIWRGETLLAAPVAGLAEGWTAVACDALHPIREIPLNPGPQSLS